MERVLQTHQLLLELGAMQAKDQQFKAVVFSSWGRLLRLVEEALAANGISHVSLAGTQPEKRANALRTFLNNPHVRRSRSLCSRHASLACCGRSPVNPWLENGSNGHGVWGTGLQIGL